MQQQIIIQIKQSTKILVQKSYTKLPDINYRLRTHSSTNYTKVTGPIQEQTSTEEVVNLPHEITV